MSCARKIKRGKEKEEWQGRSGWGAFFRKYTIAVGRVKGGKGLKD